VKRALPLPERFAKVDIEGANLRPALARSVPSRDRNPRPRGARARLRRVEPASGFASERSRGHRLADAYQDALQTDSEEHHDGTEARQQRSSGVRRALSQPRAP